MSMEEIEARRAALRRDHMAAFDAQRELDMEALVDLETQHGYGRTHPVKLEADAWQDGTSSPTMLILVLPKRSDLYFKRYKDMSVGAKVPAQQKQRASDMLAGSCTVYPEAKSDALEALLELADGILDQATALIVSKVQGLEADRVK